MSQPSTKPEQKYVVLSSALSLKGGASVERGTVVGESEIGKEYVPRLLTLDRPAIRRATAEEAKLEKVTIEEIDSRQVSREETVTELRTQLQAYYEREQQQLNKIARLERALQAAGVDPATVPDDVQTPQAGLPNSTQQNGGQQGGGQNNNRGQQGAR